MRSVCKGLNESEPADFFHCLRLGDSGFRDSCPGGCIFPLRKALATFDAFPVCPPRKGGSEAERLRELSVEFFVFLVAGETAEFAKLLVVNLLDANACDKAKLLAEHGAVVVVGSILGDDDGTIFARDSAVVGIFGPRETDGQSCSFAG